MSRSIVSISFYSFFKHFSGFTKILYFKQRYTIVCISIKILKIFQIKAFIFHCSFIVISVGKIRCCKIFMRFGMLCICCKKRIIIINSFFVIFHLILNIGNIQIVIFIFRKNLQSFSIRTKRLIIFTLCFVNITKTNIYKSIIWTELYNF